MPGAAPCRTKNEPRISNWSIIWPIILLDCPKNRIRGLVLLRVIGITCKAGGFTQISILGSEKPRFPVTKTWSPGSRVAEPKRG